MNDYGMFLSALMGPVALFACVGCIGTVLLALRLRRMNVFIEDAGRSIAALRRDLAVQSVAGDGLARALARDEARLGALVERQQNAQAEQRGGERPYGRAVRMVRDGLDCEALIRDCGLTRNEAELIMAMHGHGKAA